MTHRHALVDRQEFVSGFKIGLKEGFQLILSLAVAPFSVMRTFVRHDLPSHHH